MTAIKYTFDTDFDTSGVAGTNLSADKLEEIRTECFQQGMEAGKAEALTTIEQNCQYLLDNITNGIQLLTERHEEHLGMMQREAAKLSRVIIGKLAPALAKKDPLDEIDLLVENCLKNSPLEPRLVVRADETILPILEKKIEQLKLSSSYTGQVVLIGESMNNISDCRVEWADGGANRDFDALMETIDTTIQTFINAPIKGHINEEEMAVNVSSDNIPPSNSDISSTEGIQNIRNEYAVQSDNSDEIID